MKKIIWLTGLPCSGKTTIANHIDTIIDNVFLIDGDFIRTTISADLGFSMEDRNENMRRVAKYSKEMALEGKQVIVSVLSPLAKQRDMVRNIIGKENIFMVYVATPLEICEERDVKGMYKLAREGKMKNFTGISSPYEEPIDANLIVYTNDYTVEDTAEKIIKALKNDSKT